MSWYRKVFVWGLLLGSSASAMAQDSNRSFVRIGAPQPKVVRASMHFEDEPAKNGARPLTPMLPTLPVLEVQPAQTQPKVVEIDKQSKLPPIPAPPTFQRFSPKTPSFPNESIVVSQTPINLDERVIVLDEAGNVIREEAYGSRPSPRMYFQAEALCWWMRGMQLPPLVTTSPVGTPQQNVGVLGQPGTQILYGNSTTTSGPSPGARFLFGYSIDPCNWCMLEVGGFFLTPNRENFAVNSDQFPNIARPFFNINNGVPASELTATPMTGIPGDAAGVGELRVDTSTLFWGLEANVRSLLWCGCNYEVTGLVGFRYLDLRDNLNITENILVQVPLPVQPGSGEIPVQPGTFVTVSDQFTTRNRFYGGQIGGSLDYQLGGRWSLTGNLKLAFGVTQQTVQIDGSQRLQPPGGAAPINFVGGLYAVSSNIGTQSQNRFGFVPEVGLKLNYQLTDNLSLFVGYDFLYWSSVLRASDQIDQVIDLNLVPQSGKPYPPAPQVRPVVPFQTSSFWAQGVNAGFVYRY